MWYNNLWFVFQIYDGYKNKEGKMTIQKENKMGTMPIGKLIFTMSIPMVISMLVQAFYNVVDSVFVSYYDEIMSGGKGAMQVALSAVNYSFPAQNMMIGV